MKPMLPTLLFQMPAKGEWLYEIKYDGFRGMLEWDEHKLHLWSRNGKDLLPQFPEIKAFFKSIEEHAAEHFPLILDGELVILENPYKANFQRLQQRGRMRSGERILEESKKRPCHYLAFDLIEHNGKKLTESPFKKRKGNLYSLFSKLRLPLKPFHGDARLCQYLPCFDEPQNIFSLVRDHDSEGVVAKLANSPYQSGKRTNTWVKLKNWKTVSCFITAMDENNGYFYVGVWKDNEVFPLGQFLFNLDPKTKSALRSTIKKNSCNQQGSLFFVQPGICLDVYYLEWADGQMREPHFKELRFDLHPDDCTYENFLINEASFPEEVPLTHPEKVLWENNFATKLDYLRYLRKVSPFMLPFLHNRALTVIRSPHGVFGDFFYQKNKPETSPAFVKSAMVEGIDYIVCNGLKTLIWLGNQLAVEFHVPFHTVETRFVSEVVFDLDPPDRERFFLAVKAARILKQMLDQFQLISFVKLSGNKGLQIYIPLPEGEFTWEETRIFTSFAAEFLVRYDPESFTIERLKKNRGDRLYVDFVQHAEGKTIIAPYSVRKHEDGLVAAPLFWDELTDTLTPDSFTMETVLERIRTLQDPFAGFFNCKEMQPFRDALNLIIRYRSNA